MKAQKKNKNKNTNKKKINEAAKIEGKRNARGEYSAQYRQLT